MYLYALQNNLLNSASIGDAFTIFFDIFEKILEAFINAFSLKKPIICGTSFISFIAFPCTTLSGQ